ncbi:hypothetical protein FHS23_001278 [Prauserella isguenensis]|uniref:Uncharacterized protein n=1 Tax=Prauserella isguenensis TaxID=1470180 RepID=A0A839RYU9_9PSEU|nr:hypothetical protein [Prauserella isguenensis]
MNGRFLQVIAVGAGSWSASTTTIAETLQTLPALRAAVAG